MDTTAKGSALTDIVCSSLDRLVTVEMRISDYSRGVPAKLYDAARKAQGGRALSQAAAELILDYARRGEPVFITTGAGDPVYLPSGETDGPPGVVALAAAISTATGAVPVLLTEAQFVDNLTATARAGGLALRDFDVAAKVPNGAVVLPLSCGDDAAAQAQAYMDQMKPSLVIAIEKTGPAADGKAYTASGSPVNEGYRAKAELLFAMARERQVPSLGIGDNGNEIGFGRIRDAVIAHKPRGEKLATTIETDVLFPANMSNWGAYATAAALAFLTGRTEVLHTADAERRLVEACVAANAVDGSTGRHILAVDGAPLEASMAVVTLMQAIVRNGLVSGYVRPF